MDQSERQYDESNKLTKTIPIAVRSYISDVLHQVKDFDRVFKEFLKQQDVESKNRKFT
jgi:hypothetical protein